jgi:hypothetical protein
MLYNPQNEIYKTILGSEMYYKFAYSENSPLKNRNTKHRIRYFGASMRSYTFWPDIDK